MLFVNGDSLILKLKEHRIIFVGSVLKIQQIFKQKFLFPKSVLKNHIFFPYKMVNAIQSRINTHMHKMHFDIYDVIVKIYGYSRERQM